LLEFSRATKMRVLFVHPDLGVGGAERLIVDAALATKASGHEVTILTNQYDPAHCFEDTKQLEIVSKLSWIPRHMFGMCHALLAYLKIFLASVWLVVFARHPKFDIVIVDQISLPVCVFKWSGFKTLFYCHFPDKLLCVYDRKRNVLKRLYRAPIDWLEMRTTGMADVILVNSKFTKNIFRDTFRELDAKEIDVLYPSLNTEVFDAYLSQFSNEREASGKDSDAKADSSVSSVHESKLRKENLAEMEKLSGKTHIFLSINRYERKKDLKLAINAMRKLKEALSSEEWDACHLVMAGGYDWRVAENVEHYKELRAQADLLNLNENVSFLRSITDAQKVKLLRQAYCLVYTPTNEHFGIVPVEAMYCEKPVIATSTGGPLETIADGRTGFLVKPTADEFAMALFNLMSDNKKHKAMCIAARVRVIQNFSFVAFQRKLNDILNKLATGSNKKSS
jgi:alpha-1,3/alpha-1,6-mannosyltransferase